MILKASLAWEKNFSCRRFELHEMQKLKNQATTRRGQT